jgi:hypothetical protein
MTEVWISGYQSTGFNSGSRGRAEWQEDGILCQWNLLHGRPRAMRVDNSGVGTTNSSVGKCTSAIVGTSPLAFEQQPPPAQDSSTNLSPLQPSVAHQACEVLAALSLNKSQLAEILEISRPTLYDWIEGSDPKPKNAQRLFTLFKLLVACGIRSNNSITPMYLRQPIIEGKPTLFQALCGSPMDEKLVSILLHQARQFGEDDKVRRSEREERLRKQGFEEPTPEERRDRLAHNIALRAWPKD